MAEKNEYVNSLSSVKYKPSKFNIILQNKERIIIYNTYTGMMSSLNKQNENKILAILNKKNIFEGEQDSLIENLIYGGFLVNEHVNEDKRLTCLENIEFNKKTPYT